MGGCTIRARRERESRPAAPRGSGRLSGVTICKTPVRSARFLFLFFFFFKQRKPSPGLDSLRVYLRLITSYPERGGGWN